jgi:hypothetical protein
LLPVRSVATADETLLYFRIPIWYGLSEIFYARNSVRDADDDAGKTLSLSNESVKRSDDDRGAMAVADAAWSDSPLAVVFESG